MNIRNFRTTFINQLSPVYDTVEAESIFHLLLEAWSRLKRVDLSVRPDAAFTKEELTRYQTALARLQLGEPVQYLIGKTFFYGLEFEVNPSVLIPRPETEELVDWILNDSDPTPSLTVLDIGTGSGCIPISLAKNLNRPKVSAIDVSKQALDVAKRNASTHEVSINFIEQDVLSLEKLPQSFDIIVSNPPYVRELEKQEIRKNVLEHEPHLALFVPDQDALIFYRKIAQLAVKNLSGNGKLYLEINQYLGNETVELLKNIGFSEVQLKKDLLGNDRMIRATL